MNKYVKTMLRNQICILSEMLYLEQAISLRYTGIKFINKQLTETRLHLQGKLDETLRCMLENQRQTILLIWIVRECGWIRPTRKRQKFLTEQIKAVKKLIGETQ